ncbi:hypothetical protein Bca52824_075816 [Brassica carinata]|uniref:Uncharacterized protein n=1 Tax=Brassica carinata TaxID=52824 RepID=A0A8X7PSW0_BRACI|nr:hypothetical protein Bca52824_075816 [Brassica carinata]
MKLAFSLFSKTSGFCSRMVENVFSRELTKSSTASASLRRPRFGLRGTFVGKFSLSAASFSGLRLIQGRVRHRMKQQREVSLSDDILTGKPVSNCDAYRRSSI